MLSRFLSYIAGADREIMRVVPDSDRKYIAQLGATLIFSASILFFISYGSVIGAGVAKSSSERLFLGAICALLSAIVVSIDRSFIIADWFNSARQWAATEAITKPPFQFARFLSVAFRLLLSVAIAFIFSVLAETFLYSDSIISVIDEEHYQSNLPVYRRLESHREAKDAELQTARMRLAHQQQKVDALSPLSMNSPDKNVLPAYDAELAEVEALMADKRKRLESYDETYRSESERAIGEEAGDKRPGLTGVPSCGTQCKAAKKRAEAASQNAGTLRSELDALVNRRREILAHVNNTHQYHAALNDLKVIENEVATLEGRYQSELESRQEFLEKQPDFVPKSTGLARRFAALHVVYNKYSIWPEVLSLKLFIILMEMAPIIIKFLSTPKTQYAVRVNSSVDIANFLVESQRLEAAENYLAKSFNYYWEKCRYTMQAHEENILNDAYLEKFRAANKPR